MKRLNDWVLSNLLLLMLVGCNLVAKPDDNHQKPDPTPDTPSVIVVPATSYFAGLAKWNDKHLFETPRDMAAVISQLVRTERLSQVDAQKLDAAFPKMATDNRKMTPADSETLRNLK